MILDPTKLTIAQFQKFLLGAIAPRPIAFASTVDKAGNVNLSPFSFFNCFSASPPILVFSCARRVRDNSTKHTLENILETKEVVINTVPFALVEQASLASAEYEKGVNEFIKAGLTEAKSVMVKPPRVAESPVSFECKVEQVIELGNKGGAGALIICEVLLAHGKETILDENGTIDPHKIDLVGRMGENWYVRASGHAIFEVVKPYGKKCIGVDGIPGSIKNNPAFSGNDLAKLGNVEKLPASDEIESFRNSKSFEIQVESFKNIGHKDSYIQLARRFLDAGEVSNAWKVLLMEKEV